ncbi:MAG: 50S ribosomal protein L24 [bacterium]|nr:50S ribosomal protein L24 [bacterium]
MQKIKRLRKFGIKRNDMVMILSGRDKEKQGKVLKVDYKKHEISVEGMNVLKKAVRPSQQNQKGGIIETSLPLPLSKVKLICPKCSKPTKITRKMVNNKMVRVCKNEKCKEIIDKV